VFTTDPTEPPLIRLLVEPTEGNRLERQARLMIDKLRAS
jgi:hypothetical protein